MVYRDDEECSYHTYSKTNYPMGPKGKGIMEEVPKDENYEIDNQSLNIFLRMTIATIKSLDFSQGSWEYEIVLWAIRKTSARGAYRIFFGLNFGNSRR